MYPVRVTAAEEVESGKRRDQFQTNRRETREEGGKRRRQMYGRRDATGIEGRIYGTKGKDLNGLSQKAFSYSPWQTTMAKWREREHILNRFPSSVRDVFMCRATGYHTTSRRACSECTHRLVYRRHRRRWLLSRTRLLFSGASNLKGLKRFPWGGAVGSSIDPGPHFLLFRSFLLPFMFREEY